MPSSHHAEVVVPPPPDWTVSSLHYHLASVIKAADLRYQERYDAQEKAVIVAFKLAAETSAHEFREILTERLGEITESMHKRAGGDEVSASVAASRSSRIMVYAVAGGTLAAAAMSFLLQHFVK